MSHTQELNNIERKFKQRFNQLNTIQSRIDLQEQDILHYIEFEKYNAAIGSKLLKKLREIRIERREIKDEYEELQSILRRFRNGGLTNFKRPNKKYTYRTVTLESVLETIE